MALVASISGEEKARKPSFGGERRPWMLKDYLREDMSSCSSNGFRSFPRRQCCTAVRNIIESEKIIRNRSIPPRRVSRTSRSVSSVVQRTSVAVLNAVKLLPFNFPSGDFMNAGNRKRILPRSFSKKLFKRTFWMMKKSSSSSGVGEMKKVVGKDTKQCDEIERWISSGVVCSEKYQPSDFSNDTTVTNTSSSSTTTTNASKSDNWSEITSTSDNLTYSTKTDVVERREKSPKKDDEEEEVGKRVKSAWLNEASKKEQLSRLKGTQERLMKKLRRFDSIDLGSLLSCTQVEDRSLEFSMQESVQNEDEKKAKHLLDIMKVKMSTMFISYNKLEPKNYLLLDFFQENLAINKEDDTLLLEAEDWLNGHYDKSILGSKASSKREPYSRDMEEGSRWPRDAKLVKEEVVVELGDEIFSHLIEELLQECCFSLFQIGKKT